MIKESQPNRQSLRLPEYDYSRPGAYFVTVNCYKKEPLFGKIVEEEVDLNDFGEIAKEKWHSIPQHFPLVSLDAFIVMPNHIHGILIINETSLPDLPVRARHASPIHKAKGAPSGSLGAIIGSYKSAVTRSINQLRKSPGTPAWHRNYFERVIRDQPELDSTRHYIAYNALKNSAPSFS